MTKEQTISKLKSQILKLETEKKEIDERCHRACTVAVHYMELEEATKKNEEYMTKASTKYRWQKFSLRQNLIMMFVQKAPPDPNRFFVHTMLTQMPEHMKNEMLETYFYVNCHRY